MHEQANTGDRRPRNLDRRREQQRDHGTLPAQLRRSGNVLILDGHGLTVTVDHGRLTARDGTGRTRHERSFGKVSHGLGRVVVLGTTGTISLAALNWLRDQSVPLITLDNDHRPLCTSAVSIEDARLLRAQALASTTPVGLAIARYLLGEKLRGQLEVLERIGNRGASIDALAAELEQLEHATTLDEMLTCEREAALSYWRGWSDLELHFASADRGRIPESWRRFNQRQSPLSQSPRLPVNPANAILGYLYTLLAAEARVACLTFGLSPTLGVVHADYRHRDSFCLDLIEAARPAVDAYVLDLITSRIFEANDFFETRRGVCRILPPLTHTLAKTTLQWGQLLGPICEHTASLLAHAPESRITHLPTPLTSANRQQAGTPKRPRVRPPRQHQRPPRVCARCSGPLPHQRRVYCLPCETIFRAEQRRQAGSATSEAAQAQRRSDRSHGGLAAYRRGSTNISNKRAAREWDERYGKLIDLSAFEREILPLIQAVPLSHLQRATGLSLRYVSQVRRGEKTPHPRHWTALIEATRRTKSAQN